MLCLGISIRELIYELCEGIRLPDPPDCPAGICRLIQTCFFESPSQRPYFVDIKQNIKSTCDALLKGIQLNKAIYENVAESSYASMMPLEKAKSNNMKEKYMQLQKATNKNPKTSNPEEIKEGIYENMFSVKSMPLKKINSTREDTSISIIPLDRHNLEYLSDIQGICLDDKGYTPMTPRKKMFT